MQIASILALVIALPLAFIVVLTQTNTLQDTSKGLVPAAIDPIFGATTFVVLLLTPIIGVGLLLAAGAFIWSSGR